MKFNDTKFVRVLIGSNNKPKSKPLYTPEHSHIIDQQITVGDLGVMIDNDCKYNAQINTALKKSKDKCSWILRRYV